MLCRALRRLCASSIVSLIRWILVVWRVFTETIGTVPATAFAAVPAFQQEGSLENDKPVLNIVVFILLLLVFVKTLRFLVH